MIKFYGSWMLTLSMVWQNVLSQILYMRDSHRPQLWPKPRNANLSDTLVLIRLEHFKLNLQNSPNETRNLLNKMTDLAFNNILAECGNASTTSISSEGKEVILTINVRLPHKELTWATSEEYMLDVINKDELHVNIYADTIYGARHALETFTQLVTKVITREKKCIIHIVSAVEIDDAPVYKHRGLLLDTARHYFNVTSIIRTLNGMAASKMNVFHWHITDSQSFPLESFRMQELSRNGAFSPSEIYTKEDIEDIARLAQLRGIRIMLEIDGPGHVYAGWDFGEGLYERKVMNCSLNGGQLNPANPVIYEVLRLLYRDVAEYLPKPILFHMGGDEVDIDCWFSNNQVNSYARSKHFRIYPDGYFDVWSNFHKKALNIWDEEYLAAGGKEKQPVMIWSSTLTNPNDINKYFNPDRFIIEVWDQERDTELLLDLGYRLVMAPVNFWYLDHGFWADTVYHSWEEIYVHMLPDHPNITGGEVALWTEVVDESSLDDRLWPRTAAFAERMWSDPPSRKLKDARSRLFRHRDRLVARGLKPQTL